MSNVEAVEVEAVESVVETKVPVEQKRIRGKNSFDVLSQIVNEFNSSNGWALVKVVPSILNIEVYLERSSLQSNEEVEVTEGKTKEVVKPKTTTKSKVVGDKKVTPVKEL